MAKLLFLNRRYSHRGGSVVVANLSKHLSQLGHDVDVVAFTPEGLEDFPQCEELWRNLKTQTIQIPRKEDSDQQLWQFAEAGTNYLQRHYAEYDRIILDSWINCLALIRSGIPSDSIFQLVQSEPNTTTIVSPSMWLNELLQILPRFPMSRIAVSKAIAKLFEQKYGQQMPVMKLFIDDAYHRASFIVKDQSPLKLISSSGSFNEPAKGLAYLLEQLNQIHSFSFELTLVCPIAPAIDVSRFSFPILVTNAANPNQMIQLLQQHDIYLNTSTKESFCLALAEAIALGMPCIALDSIGNREYFDGDNFIFVEDSNTFLGELKDLGSYEKRLKLHLRAKESMAQFTLENSARELSRLLNI